MKNLKSVIQYECMTSFKYIWVFYAIYALSCSLIMLFVGMLIGDFKGAAINSTETSTLVFIGILGAMGFKGDFKMLIQNGFTRNYIFVATFSMFCFISGTMAFIDTAAGNVLHFINSNCISLYGSIYGYENIFMNWLWLSLLYVLVCSLLYLIVLVVNKVGKTASVCLSIGLGCFILLIAALFRYVFSAEFTRNILAFFKKAMGFMTDGTVNYLYPVAFLFVLAAVLGTGAYMVIRSTELK